MTICRGLIGNGLINQTMAPAIKADKNSLIGEKTILYLAMMSDHFSAQEAKEYGLIY